MKSKKSLISSANLTVGASHIVLDLLLFLLLSEGVDPHFEKPIVWVIMGAFALLMAIHLIKNYPLYIDKKNGKGKYIFKWRNPFVMWSLLLLFPKQNDSVLSLNGQYEIIYEGNNFRTIQINQPSSVDRLFDLFLVIIAVGFWGSLYIILTKVDILRYGLAIIFFFVYTSLFFQKRLIIWCYEKFSYEWISGVRISPLIYHPSKLATTSDKNVLLNPRVLNFHDSIVRYIVEHERGHLTHTDYKKGFVFDLFFFLFGMLYCYLEIENPHVAFLALIPMILIFFLQNLLVTKMELRADTHASKQLGEELCIHALRQLKSHFKTEDDILLGEFSSLIGSLSKIFGRLKGGISIDTRITHLESLRKEHKN